MSTIEVHWCPRCELRFATVAEMQAHLEVDHHVDLRPFSTDPAELRVPEPAPPTRGDIIVPVDPLAPASSAPLVAAAVAASARLAVRIVSVAHDQLHHDDATAVATATATRIRAIAREATSASLVGDDIAGEILAAIRAGRPDLVCLASRGRSALGEVALGSVSEVVARRAVCPVMLVGPHVQPSTSYKRLVVGVDGSVYSEAAVAAAARLGHMLGADVELIEVIDDGTLPEDVAETAVVGRQARRFADVVTGYDVIHAKSPVKAIVDHLDDGAGTIAVVGTHGRTGLARLRMGSVALGLVRHAPTPVLIVPPALAGTG